jgi:TonB-dependent siderophore receptor
MFFARRNVVVTAILLALSAAPVAVYAQASYNFDLPSQPLADALRAVGSLGGVNVTFEPAAVQGRNAPALKGNYSVQQALDHLLAGSGLVLRTTQGGSFLVEMGNATDAKAHSAAVQAKDFDFNIHPQNLSTTLRAIAHATGQRVYFDVALVSKKKADAVRGRLTTMGAVQQALSGTGLYAEKSSSGVVTILPESTKDLPTIVVQATIEGLSATRLPTALKEIPQSVSVISQDTLQQQNAFGLADAFQWATGITVQQSSSTDANFLSRGFYLGEVHIDGGGPITLQPSTNTAASSPVDDLSEYDHIEVLRGADALFGGAGNPGATVSLQRKQPQADDEASLTVSMGSYDYFREMLDATGPLGFDGALRGRVVVANTDQDYFYNIANRKQHKIYGILDYDLTPNTLLTVGGSVEQVNTVPFTEGLPRYLDGTDPHLPRSTALAFPWNRSTTHNNEAFVQLTHHFNDNWKLKIDSTMIDQDTNGDFGAVTSSGINPVTNLVSAPQVSNVTSSSQAVTLDATLTGAFDLGGRRQEVVAGMDYSKQALTTVSQTSDIIGPPLNPWSFDPTAYNTVAPASPLSPIITTDIYNYTKQIGGYAALRFHFGDGWSAIVGARDSYYRSESTLSDKFDLGPTIGGFAFSGAPTKNLSTGVITPYAGLTYDITKRYTLYASYADIYSPNSGQITAANSVIPPVQGDNLEVGAKAAWYNGLLNGSLALFKINQRNYPVYDPEYQNRYYPCCYLAGDNTSKGVEAELSGHLTQNWQVSASYTFNVNRENANESNVPGVAQGALSTITPKHLLKIWTNYQLPGMANRWSVGGGVRAQSSSYNLGQICPIFNPLGVCLGNPSTPYTIRQGFYTVATLRAGYRINTHWSLALNVDNLFNRAYYQTLGTTLGNNWYGTPRNFMVTITGHL